jgi:hypothetical protein
MTIHPRSCCKICGAVICMVLFWGPWTEIFARPPQATEGRGIVAAVDHNARMLHLQRAGEAVPLPLTWSDRTRFIKQDTAVTPAELRKGGNVTVWYHTPLFGPRWATKIQIEAELKARKEPSSFPQKP